MHRLKIREGGEEEFVAIMRSVAEKANTAEPETLIYELRRTDEPGVFVALECFTSKKAHARHQAHPHHKAAIEKLGALIEDLTTEELFPAFLAD